MGRSSPRRRSTGLEPFDLDRRRRVPISSMLFARRSSRISPRVGWPRADPRRPHGRAGRTRRGSSARGRFRARGADRLGLEDDRRAPPSPVPDFTAGCASRRRDPRLDLARPRRNRSRARPRPRGCVVVILPGRRQAQRLWPRALETAPVQRVLARAPSRAHKVLRFFGTPESAVASSRRRWRRRDRWTSRSVLATSRSRRPLRRAGGGGARRRHRRAPERLGRYLFGEDEHDRRDRPRPLPVHAPHPRHRRVLHGGLVAARLTSVPGSSDVFRGAVVACERREGRDLGVPSDVLETYGPSRRRREAMAQGVRERLAWRRRGRHVHRGA